MLNTATKLREHQIEALGEMVKAALRNPENLDAMLDDPYSAMEAAGLNEVDMAIVAEHFEMLATTSVNARLPWFGLD